jgi:shikimate kinase
MVKEFPSPVILYLLGLAGTGKLTIGQALQPLGFKLIDNHLINDPIFRTLDLDGKTAIPNEAWAAVHQIRDIVLKYIATDSTQSFIFTNELLEGCDSDRDLFQKIQSLAQERRSVYIPVRLLISPEERSRRIVCEDRRSRCKWVALDRRQSIEVLSISHPHLLTLDVTKLSAEQAAKEIEGHIFKVLGQGHSS